MRDELIRQGGLAGGERGSGSRSEGSVLKHDKKDLAVWKLVDKVGKLDFRHWVEAVEINLEAIHGWSKPGKVLDLIRREDTEVTTISPKEIVKRASGKLEEEGLGPVDSSDWNDFETRSRLFLVALLGKTNKEMREKAAGISNKNG